MNTRQAQILDFIIREHVKTSEPIGSEAVVRNLGLNISPATVRLEMARLEREGYIFQPHTSAGRIPQDRGYRWFVSSVDDKAVLTHREEEVLKKRLTSFQNPEKIIKQAADILSELTYCTALATLSSSDIYFHGITNIMRQPEFIDRPMILGFADLMDHLNEVLRELPPVREEIVYIGEESPYLKKAGCSIIISPYSIHEREGLLGLLGPTRMSYERNIPLLEFVAESLKEF